MCLYSTITTKKTGKNYQKNLAKGLQNFVQPKVCPSLLDISTCLVGSVILGTESYFYVKPKITLVQIENACHFQSHFVFVFAFS